jgi:hypothetical protein
VSSTDVLPHAAATPRPPGPLGEGVAGLITAVGCVLLGAPAGLVWAALAPRAEILVAADRAGLADPVDPAFIATDGYFLVAAAVAGLLCGVLVLVLGPPYGPGPVVGLVVGGLLAAEVARRTGQLVGVEDARAFLQSGQEGVLGLTVRLRSRQALAAWPVAALVVVMVVLAWADRREQRA